MLNFQARITAVMTISVFALACSSALSGERSLSNQAESAPPSAATPAPRPERETLEAPAKEARSPFPAPPLIVHYEYVPHYFVQWLDNHPHYARIEAAVTDSEPPAFNLTLTEKGSGRQIGRAHV